MSHHDEGVADAKRRAKQARGQQELSGRFNPPVGKTTIRILKTPADKDRNSPPLYMEFYMHNRVGPNQRYVRCGNEPGERGNCWLCNKADKFERKGKTKLAQKLRPQKKMALQVAVLDKEADELVGPLLWIATVSKKVSEKTPSHKILGIFTHPKSEKILDHKRGRNITIKRIGTDLDTTYPEAFELDDERSRVPREILNELKPFADTDIRPYDEEYMKAAYYGTEDQKGENMAKGKKKNKKKHGDEDLELEDDSNEEDESEELDDPSDTDEDDDESDKKKKKKKKSKKSRDDDDDDEDDDDEEDDDDDEDEDEDDDDDDESSDKKKKKKKKKHDDDDDSSEDDDEDEDEDEEEDDEDEDDDDDDESEDKKKKKKKKKSNDDDDDDDDDEEEEDDDEEEDDEEEDDEEEDEDDDSDKKKKKKRKPRSDKGQKRKPRKKKGKR